MVGIYVRLSVEDDDSNSIENQIREGKRYAHLNGYDDTQIKIYNEGEGVKGSTPIKDRPALNEMMNDIKSGLIKIVWTRKQSRISRKLRMFNDILEQMIDLDVKLFMGDRGMLDLQSPLTKMMLQIMAAFDEYAPNQQSSETIKSLRDNAAEGKVWGTIPYGYKTKKMIPYIDKEQGKIIERIFKQSLKNIGTSTIAQKLNEDNIPTKWQTIERKSNTIKRKNRISGEMNIIESKNIKWSSKTVYDMLKNKWYIGTRTYDGKEYNNIPPIVSDKLFYDVQTNLTNNRSNTGKKVNYRYLLKGLLKCGKCGRNYNGARKYNNSGTKSKYLDNYYMCSSKRSINHTCDSNAISITMLESFIIKHLFKTKDLLNHLKNIDNNDGALNALKDDLTTLKKQYKEEIKRADNIAAILADKGLDNNQRFVDMLNTSDNAIKTYKYKIDATNRRIEEHTNGNRIKTLQDSINKYSDKWNFADYKEAVHNIIEHITIEGHTDKNVNGGKTDYTIEIEYKSFDETSIFFTSRPYKNWMWIENVEGEGEQQTVTRMTDGVELTKDDIIEFD